MDNLIESAKEKLANITEGATNLFRQDIVESIKDYGIEKLKDAWNQIEEASDVFAKTGYSITAIDINLAIPPTIILSFDQIENISDEDEQKILEENKEKTVLYSILVALFKANAVQQTISSVQYKFVGLTIELGLSPKVDMKFKKIS